MRRFLLRLFLFALLSSVAGEVIIRVFKLTPDIPQRFVDATGIQRYIPGQQGYYTNGTAKWEVNRFGWLGRADTGNDTIISVIGDSYIENIMNPRKYNQGNLLKTHFSRYGFFEAGRSGVSFIEAMQITNLLDTTIHPKYQLVYVSDDDFYESFAGKHRYTDRMQIDLDKKLILNGALKQPGLKKILYSCKLLYYLYLRFPVFVDQQNKAEHSTPAPAAKDEFRAHDFRSIFEYCLQHYQVNKIVLVFHPGTDKRIIDLSGHYGFKSIALDNSHDKTSWILSAHDGHWSGYGHTQVASQISRQLPAIIINTMITSLH